MPNKTDYAAFQPAFGAFISALHSAGVSIFSAIAEPPATLIEETLASGAGEVEAFVLCEHAGFQLKVFMPKGKRPFLLVSESTAS